MADVPVCSPPDRNPRVPSSKLPTGTVDCHTHVFGPAYPLSPRRGYTPQDASLAELLHMHGQLGVDRVVFVQPSVYGTDNSAILDAMAAIPGRARAVVALGLETSHQRLIELNELGVRGVRLNLADKGGMPIEFSQIGELADRIRELGWHLEFLFRPEDLETLAPILRQLPVPVSIAHFGYVHASAGLDYPPFQTLLELLREDQVWIKLSAPYRLGDGDLPPWDNVVPLAHALMEANLARALWATDWPHPNKFGAIPNDADLAEQVGRWLPDPALQARVLIKNPSVLYGF